jgi:undecaprenyl-diphosphatase
VPDLAGRATDREVAQAARPRLLAGAAAMALSALPLTALALLVRDASAPVARFDQRVDERLTRFALDHDGVRAAAEAGAVVLHPFVFRGAVVAVAAWLLWRGARAAALWATVTVVVGSLLGVALKLLVQRSRPVLDEPVSAASGYSFPSGHALNAALGVTILLVLLWRPLARRRWRAAALAVGVLLVLATCLDRLLLGVHFPTDVLAGTLTGVLVVAASWVAFGPVLRERARREADRAAPTEGAP